MAQRSLYRKSSLSDVVPTGGPMCPYLPFGGGRCFLDFDAANSTNVEAIVTIPFWNVIVYLIVDSTERASIASSVPMSIPVIDSQSESRISVMLLVVFQPDIPPQIDALEYHRHGLECSTRHLKPVLFKREFHRGVDTKSCDTALDVTCDILKDFLSDFICFHCS